MAIFQSKKESTERNDYHQVPQETTTKPETHPSLFSLSLCSLFQLLPQSLLETEVLLLFSSMSWPRSSYTSFCAFSMLAVHLAALSCCQRLMSLSAFSMRRFLGCIFVQNAHCSCFRYMYPSSGLGAMPQVSPMRYSSSHLNLMFPHLWSPHE